MLESNAHISYSACIELLLTNLLLIFSAEFVSCLYCQKSEFNNSCEQSERYLFACVQVLLSHLADFKVGRHFLWLFASTFPSHLVHLILIKLVVNVPIK